MEKTKEEVLREKILAGADKLFQKYGLLKTTMEDIAREAGKGKSTLYYYFKSKEEILDAIIQQENAKLFNSIQSAVAEAPTAKEKIQTFFQMRFEYTKRWSNLYKVMVAESVEALQNGECISAPYRKQSDYKEVSIIKSILQFGIISGEFRVFSEEELDMMAFIFMSMQHGLEMDLVIHDKIDQMLANLNFVQSIMVNGIKKE